CHFKNTLCRYQHLCHMSYVVVFCNICHMAQLKEGFQFDRNGDMSHILNQVPCTRNLTPETFKKIKAIGNIDNKLPIRRC
ncbi:MAG: hypothetical protein JSW26_08245, partial [Desulfobacterales bacterium]